MKVINHQTDETNFLYTKVEKWEWKFICWDPKDGELWLDRTKPGEILVEVRRDSDVQIDLQIWL